MTISPVTRTPTRISTPIRICAARPADLAAAASALALASILPVASSIAPSSVVNCCRKAGMAALAAAGSRRASLTIFSAPEIYSPSGASTAARAACDAGSVARVLLRWMSSRNALACSSRSASTAPKVTPVAGSAARNAIRTSARKASCIMSESICRRTTSFDRMARVRAPLRCVAAHNPAAEVAEARIRMIAPAAATLPLMESSFMPCPNFA